jgi:hypothetical protein
VRSALALCALLGTAAGCQPADSVAGESGRDAVRIESTAAAAAATHEAALENDTATQPGRPSTVCERFARRVADFAAEHPHDPVAFLAALSDELVAGTDDPFELKAGLEQKRWNQAYFYAGHGGFRDEIDDSDRYSDGGNHQPGHFVSVLLIAHRFGEENARIAIAYAGDYDPGDEDDLRLSGYAIELGTGLAGGTVTPVDIARRVAGFCR